MQEPKCTYIDWLLTAIWILIVIQIVFTQVNHNEKIASYNQLNKSLTKNNELRESQIKLMNTVGTNQKILLQKLNLGY